MNPYTVLGVARDADADTIKKAFRKLAKQHHPDRNEGSAEAERKFKEINRAFEVLSDPERRAAYDQFGAASLEPGFDANAARAWQQRSTGPRGGFGGGADFGVEDLLSQLFGAGGGRAPGGFSGGGFGGADVRAELSIDFRTAALGGERELRFGDGRTLTVRIPPGIRDGETLRLAGKGQPSPRGGQVGDLLLTVHTAQHPVFRREGEDLYVDLPITVGEALKGATVEVPTLDGPVRMRVPPGTQTDRKLRLRGKGIARRGQAPGDLYARVVVVVPEAVRPEQLDEALRAIEGAYGAPVRDGLLRSAAA
ncbi:MAG: DnaJ domain-containing protein [Alphaproteobacteria bacterium]|nr:DnaJ domain-containing protein [Alphaproteobacteria bacterium]